VAPVKNLGEVFENLVGEFSPLLWQNKMAETTPKSDVTPFQLNDLAK